MPHVLRRLFRHPSLSFRYFELQRLVGTGSLELGFAEGSDLGDITSALQTLCGQDDDDSSGKARPDKKAKKTGGKGSKKGAAGGGSGDGGGGNETIGPWDEDGEPSFDPPGNKRIPVARLLKLLESERIVPRGSCSSWALNWVRVLDAFSAPGGAWKSPFVRVVIPAPELQKCLTALEDWTPNAGVEPVLQLPCHVYFGRLIFYLIAEVSPFHYSPVSCPCPPCPPCPALPSFNILFSSCCGAAAGASGPTPTHTQDAIATMMEPLSPSAPVIPCDTMPADSGATPAPYFESTHPKPDIRKRFSAAGVRCRGRACVCVFVLVCSASASRSGVPTFVL